MLKNNKKKKNFIKCDKCKERFESNEDDIVKTQHFAYIECHYCGQQTILRK